MLAKNKLKRAPCRQQLVGMSFGCDPNRNKDGRNMPKMTRWNMQLKSLFGSLHAWKTNTWKSETVVVLVRETHVMKKQAREFDGRCVPWISCFFFDKRYILVYTYTHYYLFFWRVFTSDCGIHYCSESRVHPMDHVKNYRIYIYLFQDAIVASEGEQPTLWCLKISRDTHGFVAGIVRKIP